MRRLRPGAATTAARRPQSFGLDPTPNETPATARPAGQTAPTQGWTGFKDSSWEIAGEPTLSYEDPPLLLESVCKKVTATTPAGGTLSRKRVYSIDQFALDTRQTYKLESGLAAGRGVSASYCSMNAFNFGVSTGEDRASMGGSFIGDALNDPITVNNTSIVASDFTPCIPTHAKIFYASSFANLVSSPTEITTAFEANFAISDRVALSRYLGKTNGGISGTVETIPGLEFDLMLADEATPLDTILSGLRAGTKTFFRLQFLGPLIETTIYKEFTLDICTVLRDAPGREDRDNEMSRSIPLTAAYDAVGAKIFDITIVNDRTVL